MPDIRVHNFCSIVVLKGVTDDGDRWLDTHLQHSPWQRWAGGYAVEPRYVDDILDGAHDDGLEVA